MQAEELTKRYIERIKIMQLATSVDNQPWSCTLHYYSDSSLNFYWISTKDRKHSEDIATNPMVAAAILVHENTEEERYIIGISISGKAELIGERVDPEVGNAYIKKIGREETLLSDIASGKNPHKFYRLVPSRIVLFDTKNFPDNPKIEIKVPRLGA